MADLTEKELKSAPWLRYGGQHKLTLNNPWRFRVDWTLNSNQPGLYGWTSVIRMFPTLDDALAAAKQSMGRARSVYVDEFTSDQPGRRTVFHYRRNNANQR